MPLKVQPVDSAAALPPPEPAKPAGKSLLKRLFERQILRSSSTEKLVGEVKENNEKEVNEPELEPSSVCLDRMIVNFIEESNEKPVRCGRRRCNCFNGNSDDSDDDADIGDSPPIVSAAEILKGLIPCVNAVEKNLLAEAMKIIDQLKYGKPKIDHRRTVADGLTAIGYDAAVCKSKWEQTSAFPAGEYEYVDVSIDCSRFIIDVDFRSEFEIARSTKSYKTVLQCLPTIYVGQADRLKQIVAVVCEAARQSIKKKGLHFPPWRKPEYMRAKWLSPYQRSTDVAKLISDHNVDEVNSSGELDKEKLTVVISPSGTLSLAPWSPPAVKPKVAVAPGTKMVTGLASMLKEKQ